VLRKKIHGKEKRVTSIATEKKKVVEGGTVQGEKKQGGREPDLESWEGKKAT